MRTFSLNFAKILRIRWEHTRRSEKNDLFFTAFTFLNPENLNYVMSYMESECMYNFVLSTHADCVWSIIHLHCTCTIHWCENYNHCLILSTCGLKDKNDPGSTRKMDVLIKKECTEVESGFFVKCVIIFCNLYFQKLM